MSIEFLEHALSQSIVALAQEPKIGGEYAAAMGEAISTRLSCLGPQDDKAHQDRSIVIFLPLQKIRI